MFFTLRVHVLQCMSTWLPLPGGTFAGWCGGEARSEGAVGLYKQCGEAGKEVKGCGARRNLEKGRDRMAVITSKT